MALPMAEKETSFNEERLVRMNVVSNRQEGRPDKDRPSIQTRRDEHETIFDILTRGEKP
jgi:hypothetical protein